MSLFEQYEPALDQLYNKSLCNLMDKGEFYKAIRIKFEALGNKIHGKSHARAQKDLSNSIINKILKVHNRILLIRDLKAKINNADQDNWVQVYMYPGLVTYLYLTCFDQLGGADNGWRLFSDWLKSESYKDEVNNVVENSMKKFDATDLGETKKMMREVSDHYQRIFGVKNSFMRFLRHVIPIDTRNTLLASILVEKWVKGSEQLLPFIADEFYKEKWLYDTRNNYTHSALTTETNVRHGKYFDGKEWYIREQILERDGTIVIWVPDNFNLILEDCVLNGIKFLIEKQ